MSFLGSASSVLVTVAASLCWLLVVLQVGRGALCAIFVGEPDLTHNFTYFIPALFQESNDGVDSTAGFGSESFAHLDMPHVGNTIWQHALTPLLVTFCQMVSSTLLFVVVMFGVLSMGSSVEDSVHPLRFLVASYSGSLLRARQWHWLPYFLLSKSVLVHIDSTRAVAHFASNNQLGPVAGNTSRVFFSSSSDLTSFYQNLLRQTADGPTVPTTLLPGGILPESFLKSKMWGRRVFLLFAGNAHAGNRTEDSKGAKALASPSASQKVSTKQLLAYAWIVCGLSMTWPSVLRTTGLISERAYILPIASMVQPLWAQYNNEQDFSASAASIPVDDATELDEGIVGLLATPALLADEAVARECTFDLCLTDKAADGLPRDVLANDRTLFCDKKYSGQLNAGTSTGTGTGTGACPRNTLYNDVQFSSMHWPLESWLTLNKTSENLAGTTDDPVPATQMAFERKVSRKQLHQSLSADTLQRRLARWCVRLACQITPHTCISTGYIVWWLSPDLIVPISPVTVDMQLGYQPPSTSGWNRALVLQPSAFSEWYGMLRRLESGSVWLPHADDGTPLRLQRQARPPSADSEVSSQNMKQHHPFENSQLVPAVRRWIQMTFEAGIHGLRLASLQLKGFLSVLVLRMWSAGALFVRMAASSVISSIQGTRAGAVVTTAVDILSCVASGVAFIVGSIWTAVLCPLWYYLLLVAEIIFGCVALAASCVASAVMGILGSMSLPEKEPGVSQTGAVGVASPLFVSEYWDSVAGYGGDPALQRLRPELWPHVVANSADSTVVLNDAMAQPQHPALDLHKDKRAGGGHSADVAGGGSRTASAAASWAITAEKGLASEDSSSSSSVGAAGAGKQERERSAAPDPAQTRRSRKAWTTLDWLLAAYRVALSILAFRTVFQPSRSSRMFVV
ncbi:hypothetical protein H4S06_002501 [Coemansia sp. BCRC 34490]|nr:hypothetical protein H4S06_002501 [Coemansia sp. BCRC 34490]